LLLSPLYSVFRSGNQFNIVSEISYDKQLVEVLDL